RCVKAASSGCSRGPPPSRKSCASRWRRRRGYGGFRLQGALGGGGGARRDRGRQPSGRGGRAPGQGRGGDGGRGEEGQGGRGRRRGGQARRIRQGQGPGDLHAPVLHDGGRRPADR